MCKAHFEAKKQERRAQNKQEKSPYICYNVIKRHFVVPQNPLNSETKKKLIFIPILIGWIGALITFVISMESLSPKDFNLFFTAAAAALVVCFCVWAVCYRLSVLYLQYTNKEYNLFVKKRSPLFRFDLWQLRQFEKRAQHQFVIQILINLEDYQLLKVYKETYGLEYPTIKRPISIHGDEDPTRGGRTRIRTRVSSLEG
jgi:hypothetical protein